MKVRVVYKLDKTIVVIHYAPKSKLSEQEAFDKAMQGELKGLPYEDMDNSLLPQSREDRNAWEGEKGKGVTVNQAKAQQIRNDKEKEIKIRTEMRKLAEKSLEDKGEL